MFHIKEKLAICFSSSFQYLHALLLADRFFCQMNDNGEQEVNCSVVSQLLDKHLKQNKLFTKHTANKDLHLRNIMRSEIFGLIHRTIFFCSQYLAVDYSTVAHYSSSHFQINFSFTFLLQVFHPHGKKGEYECQQFACSFLLNNNIAAEF